MDSDVSVSIQEFCMTESNVRIRQAARCCSGVVTRWRAACSKTLLVRLQNSCKVARATAVQVGQKPTCSFIRFCGDFPGCADFPHRSRSHLRIRDRLDWEQIPPHPWENWTYAIRGCRTKSSSTSNRPSLDDFSLWTSSASSSELSSPSRSSPLAACDSFIPRLCLYLYWSNVHARLGGWEGWQ